LPVLFAGKATAAISYHLFTHKIKMMQSLRFMFIAVFAIISTNLFAQTSTEKTDTIKVYGECGMCKSRIQKTLKIDGISVAVWDVDSKMLTVTYDPAAITNDEIQQKLAAVGHDTDKYKADDKVYDKLPGCCHYGRKKAGDVKEEAKKNLHH
jgi:mercuric ion binding protein